MANNLDRALGYGLVGFLALVFLAGFGLGVMVG